MVKNSFLLKIDTSKDTSQNPNLFTVNYDHFDLDVDNEYEMALVRMSLYYSWYNIASSFGNNQFTVFNGSSETTYTIPDGFYNIEEINTQVQTLANTTNVAIVPNYNTYRVAVNVSNSFQLRLTNHSGFAQLLGFGAVNITSNTVGTLPADITRGITSAVVSCSITEPNSFENNSQSQILYSFAPDKSPGSLLSFEPNERLYLPMRGHRNHINNITIVLRDNKNRLIDTNSEPICYLLHIRKR